MENKYSVHLRDEELDVVRGVRVSAESEADAIATVMDTYQFYMVELESASGGEFDKVLMGKDKDDIQELVDERVGGDVTVLTMEAVSGELIVDSVREVT